MSGWIKIHRKILEWEWYDDANTFRLFMHLILKANHKPKKYRGKEVGIGCLLTGRDILSTETGLSVRQVRTSLERLKSTNEVTIKTTSQGTEIKIVNYHKYQLTTSETTNERPTNDQQTTTNKNVKNNKEVILDEWIEYRRTIKKPLRKPTIDKLLEDIENKTEDCVKYVIENSIRNGWIGLFWDKYVEPIKNNSSDDDLYNNVMRKLQG